MGKDIGSPVRMILVGRLDAGKGVGRALTVLARLREMGIRATLDVIGDGPERAASETQAADMDLRDLTAFHGWVPRTELGPLYTRSHIFILPSSSEGWPKVLSEAMAYGVVPVCSGVGSIPQLLREFGVGRIYAPSDTEGMAGAIAQYESDPIMWRAEAGRGMHAAERFSYGNYLQAVRRTVLGEDLTTAK